MFTRERERERDLDREKVYLPICLYIYICLYGICRLKLVSCDYLQCFISLSTSMFIIILFIILYDFCITFLIINNTCLSLHFSNQEREILKHCDALRRLDEAKNDRKYIHSRLWWRKTKILLSPWNTQVSNRTFKALFIHLVTWLIVLMSLCWHLLQFLGICFNNTHAQLTCHGRVNRPGRMIHEIWTF